MVTHARVCDCVARWPTMPAPVVSLAHSSSPATQASSPPSVVSTTPNTHQPSSAGKTTVAEGNNLHKHDVSRRCCARFLPWQISYGDMDDPDALLLRILLVSDVHMAVERLAAVTDWARTAKPRWDAHVCPASAHRSSPDRAWRVWWGAQLRPRACNRRHAGHGHQRPGRSHQRVEGGRRARHFACPLGDGGEPSVVHSGKRAWVKAAPLGPLVQCSPWCCRTQHDPITTLHLKKSARPQVTSYSRNVHNSLVTLLPGLAVAGFGGSVPAFRGEEQVWAGLLRALHMVRGLRGISLRGAGRVTSPGYPYTEEHLQVGLTRLLRSNERGDTDGAGAGAGAGADDGAGAGSGAGGDGERGGDSGEDAGPAQQVILMTHCGPRGSGTTAAVRVRALGTVSHCGGAALGVTWACSNHCRCERLDATSHSNRQHRIWQHPEQRTGGRLTWPPPSRRALVSSLRFCVHCRSTCL